MVNMDTITISIEGKRNAVAPLTWAQRRTWRGSRLKYRPFVRTLTLPPDSSFRDACDAIKWAYEEFESLRTVFPLDADGNPYQRVDQSGSVDIFLLKTTDSTAENDIQTAIRHFKRERFDISAEFGAKFTIVLSADIPTNIICAASHLAVDFHGYMALRSALDGYLSGNRAQSSTHPLQSIERARTEQSEKFQRKSARALKHWRSVLEKFPNADESDRSAVMDSPALGTAATIIAKDYGISTSAVYLSAVAVIAGALIGRNECCSLLPNSNRFTLEERSFVGELVQFVPIIIQSLMEPFKAIACGAWQEILIGYRHSHYDEDALLQMFDDFDENSERKRVFDFSFNDMRVSTEERNYPTLKGDLREAMQHTRIDSGRRAHRGPGRFLTVSLSGNSTHSISIVVHDSYFPNIPIPQILLAIEALVVRAATADNRMLEHPMKFAKNYLNHQDSTTPLADYFDAKWNESR